MTKSESANCRVMRDLHVELQYNTFERSRRLTLGAERDGTVEAIHALVQALGFPHSLARVRALYAAGAHEADMNERNHNPPWAGSVYTWRRALSALWTTMLLTSVDPCIPSSALNALGFTDTMLRTHLPSYFHNWAAVVRQQLETSCRD